MIAKSICTQEAQKKNLANDHFCTTPNFFLCACCMHILLTSDRVWDVSICIFHLALTDLWYMASLKIPEGVMEISIVMIFGVFGCFFGFLCCFLVFFVFQFLFPDFFWFNFIRFFSVHAWTSFSAVIVSSSVIYTVARSSAKARLDILLLFSYLSRSSTITRKRSGDSIPP